MHRDHTGDFPFGCEILCRVLGPSKGEGNEMSQWVLKSNGQVVPRRTVRPLHIDEINSDALKKMRESFDAKIEAKLGTAFEPPSNLESDSPDEDEFVPCEDDDEIARATPDFADPVDSEGRPVDQQPMCDRLIH